MGIAPLGHFIRLPDIARGQLKLQAGDVVSLNVIKELSSSHWAIGLRGIVFRARTGFPLSAGETLQALVVKQGTRIELKLLRGAPPALPVALEKAGFGSDPVTLLVVESLIKNHVKIAEGTVASLKTLLEKMKGDPKRNARILGLLVGKGLDPESEELEALAALLDYGAGGEQERGRKEKGREPPATPLPSAEEIAAALEESIREALARPAGSLTILNHLLPSGDAENWIIVPYSIAWAERPLKGTLRFLYNPNDRKIKKVVVVAHSPDGQRSQFTLQSQTGGFALTVSSNQDRLIGTPLSRWAEVVSKLEKLGVQCDDSIHDDSPGDGFETQDEAGAYRSVDTEG